MASAEGGEQEGGGSQLAVPEDATVPSEGQQMPEDALVSLAQDGPEQEPPCGGQLMPQRFSIGTTNAFDNKKAYSYEKKQLESETIYVCDKGSRYARENEVLVLRREKKIWTAFDCVLSADGKIRHCRQPAFRSNWDDITLRGSYIWEMNFAARADNDGSQVDWRDALEAETRYE